MSLSFLYRNPQYIAHPRKAASVIKAMAAYRKANPVCAWCGGKKGLQVHHILPVNRYPDLADQPINFLTLCGAGGCNCHLVVGHSGSFDQFVDNVIDLCHTKHVAFNDVR